MDTTLLLAKLWGPAILAVGFGVFVSRPYYVRIYRDLEKDSLAVLLFGMTAMVAGTAHILYHNVWEGALATIVTLLGWGLFLKGLLFVVAPKIVDKSGDWWFKTKLINFSGALTFLAGLYLVWSAYFA